MEVASELEILRCAQDDVFAFTEMGSGHHIQRILDHPELRPHSADHFFPLLFLLGGALILRLPLRLAVLVFLVGR